jgi:hypothetical protein
MQNAVSSIIQNYEYKSKILFLTFGGIYGGIGIPVFEFYRITEEFKIRKLFLRDLRQVWYQGGLPEVGENIYSIAEFIKTQIDQQDCDKTIMIGNSAGGYAALLFGSILHADKVVAFSPQTFLNLRAKISNFDFRWSKQILNMYRTQEMVKSTLDLRDFFSRQNNNKTNFKIFYSRMDRLDTIHAKRMGEFSNFELHEFNSGGHELVKWLRDEHILYKILSSAVNEW